MLELAQSYIDGSIDPSEDDLVQFLNEATIEYDNGNEQFPDSVFNAIENILRSKNPNNLYFSEVGSDVRGGKVKLPYTLGSLDQVYEGEISKWISDNNLQNEDIVLSDKQDGQSVMSLHTKGKLNSAYSRGNGYEGADITRHIKEISKKYDYNDTKQNVVVRSEAVMNDIVFVEMTEEATKNNERVYSNSRNYIAGKMNASERTEDFYKNTRIIGTSIIEPILSKTDQFKLMEDLGYEVTHYTIVKGKDLTDSFLIDYLENRKKESLTPIDGIVIDIDKLSIRNKLLEGHDKLNPPFSKKFKVSADGVETIVEEVEWNPSKTGYIKPRVRIKPINIDGVTVTFATGFNAKFIYDKGIGKGAIIKITRAGDVIPFIESVIKPVTPDMPSYEYEWNETFVDIVLINPETNEITMKKKMLSFFDNSGLNVVQMGSGNIDKLFESGLTNIVSVIKASEDELVNIIGEANGKKIYHSIKERLNPIDLPTLSGSSGIMGRGIGKRMMKKLVDEVGSDCIIFDSISVDGIKNIPGFEKITSELIKSNIPTFQDFLKEIDGYYSFEEVKLVSSSLSDYSVVFTGVRDKELEMIIEQNGGKISSSISNKVTHVVTKDKHSTSGKMKKVIDLNEKGCNINVMDLDEANKFFKG